MQTGSTLTCADLQLPQRYVFMVWVHTRQAGVKNDDRAACLEHVRYKISFGPITCPSLVILATAAQRPTVRLCGTEAGSAVEDPHSHKKTSQFPPILCREHSRVSAASRAVEVYDSYTENVSPSTGRKDTHHNPTN